MTKLKMILTVFVLVASTWLAKAQTCSSGSCNVASCELVCNGSFEYNTGNPTALSVYNLQQVPLACGWNNYDNSGAPDACPPNATTADYFSTSSPTVVAIPCNGLGYEAARTGTAYVGFSAYNTPLHSDPAGCWYEAVEVPLRSALQNGRVYRLTFYLSLADACGYNTNDNVGARIYNSGTGPGSSQTQTVNTSTVTSNGWTQVSMTFTGSALNEDMLVIGAMFKTSSRTIATPTMGCPYMSISMPGDTYYYLEDVSMVEEITPTITASSLSGCSGETFTLTASGLDTYTWAAVGSFGGSTNASVTVVPSSSTTYSVSGTSTAGCIVNQETITIAPYACCPNPNTGTFTVRDGSLVAFGTSGATQWTSLTTGGYYTGAIAIPSTGVIQSTFAIAKSMTISTPVTFSLCNISVTEDAPIYQNAQTYIKKSWLYGCDKLWEGIISNARLEVNDAFIEDAYSAITTPSTGAYAGLICDNVVFDKNYIGITVPSCTVNPSDFQVTGSIFMCRRLTSAQHDFTPPRYTTSLAPIGSKVPEKLKGSTAHTITANAIRSNYGIYFVAAKSTSTISLNVGEASATPSVNASYTNYFDYLNCGVYNIWSKLFIRNNSFGNMITTGTGTAIAAVYHWDPYLLFFDPKMTSTKVGDAVAGSNYKNTFTSVLNGVSGVDGGTLSVTGNDFLTISKYGVSATTWYSSASPLEPVTVASNSYTDALYPFYAYDNNYIKCSVASNTVVHVQPTYTAGYCAYINEISKPANATYSITSNKYSGMLNGIYFINTSGARIVGNTVTIKKPGTGVFNADITLSNTDNSIVSDNILDCNPTNSASWFTFGVLGDACASNTIQCNTMTKVGSCVKIQGAGSPNYIHNNSFNNASTDPCLFGVILDNGANIGDIGHWSGSIWEQSDNIWGDFLYGSPNNGADTWSQGTNPNWSTGGNIYYDAGKTAALYTPSVNLFAAGSNIPFSPSSNTNTNGNSCGIGARMMSPNSGSGKTVNSNLAAIGTETGKKRILYKQGANNREINSNYNSFFMVDSLIGQFKGGDSTALASAQNINAGINAQDNVEQHQKDFNTIYIAFLNDKNSVSGSQVQDIIDLAKMCPFTEGLAVYQARALVRNWDDSTLYYNECEINVPTPEEHARNVMKALEESPSAIIVDLYPNPASTALIAKTNMNNAVLEVFDVVGKQVLSQKLSENETKIDVTSLNNGTYLYKITSSSNKVIKNGKIVISH